MIWKQVFGDEDWRDEAFATERVGVIEMPSTYQPSDSTIIWELLREFFNHEHYSDGVHRLQAKLAQFEALRERWAILKGAVGQRRLSKGAPLELIQIGANQVLDNNTAAEAYRWLEKLIENVEREEGTVDEY